MSAEQVWRNGRLPVIYRPPPGDLMVRMPGDRFKNRAWLRRGRRDIPPWHGQFKCWLMPRSCFSELAKRLAEEYGGVYIIQHVKKKDKCAPACWNAKGLECECQCLGINHGHGHPEGRWYVISDTAAVRWHGRALRWSLLKPRPIR